MSLLFKRLILFICCSLSLSALKCDIPYNIHHMVLKDNSLYLAFTENLFQLPNSIGNYLTLYYNMRGITKYLGLCFVNERHLKPTDSWLVHLPKKVCPSPVDFKNNMTAIIDNIRVSADLMDGICRTCWASFFFTFPHECRNFWLSEKQEMKSEIRQALITYGKEQNITIPDYSDAGTSVIYSRCKAGDSIMAHGALGPTGFSHYKSAAELSSRIVIVARAHKGICLDIRHELVKYLMKVNPNLLITYQNSSVFEDYATLVFANRVYSDMSTFATTAGFARDKDIYLPKNSWFTSDLGFPQFTFTNVTMLLPPLGKKLNITCHECKHFTPEDTKIVLDWLNNN